MIFLAPGWPTDGRSRPSDDFPKEYKSSPEYGKDVAKWIYGLYRSNATIVKMYEQDTCRVNRNYAAGRQYMNAYEQLWDTRSMPLDGAGATSNDATTTKSSFDRINTSRLGKEHLNFKQPLNPLPKFMAAMVGVLKEQEADVSCEAIDERSTSLRQELEFGTVVDSMFAPTMQYIQATMEMGSPPDMAPKPSTLEEMEMWKRLGTFKLGYEAAAKDAWMETERMSDIVEVKDDVIRELLTVGKSVCSIYDVDGLVKFECVDVTDVIMEDNKKSINRDPSYFARMKYMTLTEVRAKCPWLTDEDTKKLMRDFGNERGMYDNATLYGTQRRDQTYLFESTKIPVLLFWSKTIDFDYQTHVNNEDGTKASYSEPYRFRKGVGDVVNFRPEYIDWRDQEDKPGQILKPREYAGKGKRTTEVNSERNVLTGAWIIGSEHIFDYGYQSDLAFDYFSRNALIPAVSFKLQGVSFVERVIPILDQIEMQFLYIQDTLATSPKAGVAIDWRSMSSLPSENGKFLHPFDIITIGEKTGRWLYTIAPPDPHNPQPLNQKPISEVTTGMPQILATHVMMLETWYKELERQGGISEFMSGGAPADRQGLGVSNLVLQTNMNILKPIYAGWVSMKERIANFSILKIQSLINADDSKKSPYVNILGAGKYAALKSAGNFPPVYYGIKMIPKIDDLMKQEIMTLTNSALGLSKEGTPMITMSNAMYIFDKVSTGNIADVRMYLAFLEKKAQDEAIAREQARKEQETALAAQLDKQKTDNAIAINQNKSDNEMKRGYLKHRQDIEKATHSHILKKDELAQQHEHKKGEASHEQAITPPPVPGTGR